ncbi:ImmA/IrrE family metallo-endopeptidase [Vagococcus fluvialis]|uniref:ImmA/IrrE family metallo-endopeptidase n=1 Tax=Vagococcus fluvialis TaxID=2738 RepID=UPI001A8E99E2|nr:ImmA/IrrE family metallo-endopeptidase [Vagococcus fluvialis]MBO0478756.1 ImmA/IrrE family metallo-endopeptidase [Vagococcus fluvialis]
MKSIMEILKKNNIELIVTELEDDGFCIIKSRTIFVDCYLSEQRTIEIILHEAEHILSHSDYMELYRASYIYHSKFENEADSHVIDTLLEENNYQYNYSMVLEKYNIGIGYDIKYQKFAK